MAGTAKKALAGVEDFFGECCALDVPSVVDGGTVDLAGRNVRMWFFRRNGAPPLLVITDEGVKFSELRRMIRV